MSCDIYRYRHIDVLLANLIELILDTYGEFELLTEFMEGRLDDWELRLESRQGW